jgi:hypothetical protein
MSDQETRRYVNAREMSFGEGMDVLIKQGYKLATTRIPSDGCDFARGEVVIAVCGPEKVRLPLVISDITDKKLMDLSIPRLALGSFLSHDEAAQRLSGFFHTPVETISIVRHMVFFDMERFQELSDAQRELLLTLSTEEAIKRSELRPVFFPSFLHWLSAKKDAHASDWIDFLTKYSLVTDAEADILSSRFYNLHLSDIDSSNLIASLDKV